MTPSERERTRPTAAQQNLLDLLHEIGGVEEWEVFRTPRVSGGLFQTPPHIFVRLIMVGDNGRRVQVLIGPYGDVEWECDRRGPKYPD